MDCQHPSLPGHCDGDGIVCTADSQCPTGAGLTGECKRRKSNELMFSFDLPAVSESVPGTTMPYNAEGDALSLHGTNFGSVNSSVKVILDGGAQGWQDCTEAEWNPADSDGFPYITCNAPRDVVGPKALRLTVAKQTISMDIKYGTNTFSTFNAVCEQSGPDENGTYTVFYGDSGQLCAECPLGSRCLSGTTEMPLAKPGYWMSMLNISTPCTIAAYDAMEDKTTREAMLCSDYLRASGLSAQIGGKVGRCAEERWNREKFGFAIVSDTCPDPVACQPQDACRGNNTCAPEYQYVYKQCVEHYEATPTNCTTDFDCDPDPMSECSVLRPWECSKCVRKNANDRFGQCSCTHPSRCALCTFGEYYRSNNKCEECPNNPGLLVLAFIMAVICACIGGYVMHRYKFNLAFISIGVDYFQVLAIFSATDIRWPTELYAFFKFMMIFNINVDIAAPECLVPNFEYEFKWYGTMGLPVASGVMFIVGYMCSVCNERLSGRGGGKNPHLDMLIGNFLTLFYYMYLSLTRRALDVFNCNPTTPNDGYLYTEFTSVECSGSGGLCRCGEGIQARLVIPAIISFCVFSVGFPVLIYAIIIKYKPLIKEDQLLRAAGLGDDEVSNPRAFWVRQRFHKLYYHFKPGKIYWIVYIVLRKFMIAFAGLMFRGNPGFQLSIILLVLFVCFVLQVQNRPYMSSAEKDGTF